jgi:outer membrane protein OmpA-like peptidoglycan-associated protein
VVTVKSILFLFFTLSVLLIYWVISNYAKPLQEEQLKLIHLSQLQKGSMKKHLRRRVVLLPYCSIWIAQKEIQNYLLSHPIVFKPNSITLETNETKKTLAYLVKVIHHTEDKIIINIATHTDSSGSKKHNLKLSQQRADLIKKYFSKRVEVPFIMAIGYGEAFSVKKKNQKVETPKVTIHIQKVQL